MTCCPSPPPIPPSKSRPRVRGALRAAGLSVLLAACSTSPGGPPATYLSVTLVNRVDGTDGTDGTGTAHPSLCTQFPVLVGSRVTDRLEIPGDLIVHTDLDRSTAQITFVGAETITVTYSVEQIRAGVSGDPVEIAGRRQDYGATVRSGCP